jgi:outer membrane receptor protein involved in Fe transport
MAGTHSNMKTYSVPTYKGGIVGNVLENVSVYGNVGTTFRLPNQAAKYLIPAPSVANLFFWEAGAKATLLDSLHLRYAYFQSTEKLTRLDAGQYVDDGKARRAGQEVELSFGPWKRIELFTALTVHDGHYVGGANAGNLVPTVPRYIWKVGVQAESPWGTGGRVQYNDVGKWDTDPANTHSYGGYRVLDLNAYQVLARNWSIALDVKNVLDEKYSEFVGFWSGSNQYMPSLPRTVYASLRYSVN